MGHRTNPFLLRLGINRWWATHRFFRKSLRESLVEHQLFKYVENAFDRYVFRRLDYTYSHATLSFSGRMCFVTAYMYGHDLNYFRRKKRRRWFKWRFKYKIFEGLKRDSRNAIRSYKQRFGDLIRTRGRNSKIMWRRPYKWIDYRSIKIIKLKLKIKKRRRFYFLYRFGKRAKVLARVCNFVSIFYVKKFLISKYLKKSYLKIKSKLIKINRAVLRLVRVRSWVGYFRKLVRFTKNVVAYELFCKFKLLRVVVWVKKAGSLWAPPVVLVRFVVRKLKYKYTLNELLYPIMLGTKRKLFGFYAKCSGRFTRAQRARLKVFRSRNHPMNSFFWPIDYNFQDLALKYGACSIKICMVLDNKRLCKIRKKYNEKLIKATKVAKVNAVIRVKKKKKKKKKVVTVVQEVKRFSKIGSKNFYKNRNKNRNRNRNFYKFRDRNRNRSFYKTKKKKLKKKRLKRIKFKKWGAFGRRFVVKRFFITGIVYNRLGVKVGLKREFITERDLKFKRWLNLKKKVKRFAVKLKKVKIRLQKKKLVVKKKLVIKQKLAINVKKSKILKIKTKKVSKKVSFVFEIRRFKSLNLKIKKKLILKSNKISKKVNKKYSYGCNGGVKFGVKNISKLKRYKNIIIKQNEKVDKGEKKTAFNKIGRGKRV